MICPVCGSDFYTYSGGHPRHYCSRECRASARLERLRLLTQRKRVARTGFGARRIELIDRRLAELGRRDA